MIKVSQRREDLIELLLINEKPEHAKIVELMSDEQFSAFITVANKRYDAREKRALSLGKNILKKMVQLMDEDGSLLYPLEVLRIADVVRGGLMINGLPADSDDELREVAVHVEYYRSIVDTLKGDGTANTKVIQLSAHKY